MSNREILEVEHEILIDLSPTFEKYIYKEIIKAKNPFKQRKLTK